MPDLPPPQVTVQPPGVEPRWTVGARVVMSGHQPGIWHAGIAAKWFALQAVASASDADAVWLVVDQDPEPLGLRYPAVAENGSLSAATWDWMGDAAKRALATDQPPGWLEASDPATAPQSAWDGTGAVAEGLRAAEGALRAERSAPSLAAQIARAAARLLPGGSPVRLLYASELAASDAFGVFLDRMASDPVRCVERYNAAAAAHPHSGVRPLTLDPGSGRVELPLWRTARGAPRRRVYARDLAAIPRGELVPRGLAMTALARLRMCGLFIHGLGGAGADGRGGYEAVTERWIGEWLGETPAPTQMVTATMRLSAEDREASARAAQRAAWLHHHARHDPGVLGDARAAADKRARAAEIELLPSASARRAQYLAMHESLHHTRRAHAAELDRIGTQATRASAAAARATVLCDRAYAFPLHGGARLVQLRDAVAAALRRR